MPGAGPDGVGSDTKDGRAGRGGNSTHGPAGDGIPPLVLRCRTSYLLIIGGAAVVFLALATGCLAEGGPESPLFAGVLFAAGGLVTHFFLRYCLAALELSDEGFRLRGPLFTAIAIAWHDVAGWSRRGEVLGPGLLRIESRGKPRVTIPLVYEDSHLLELGLSQGGFPVW